MPDIADWGTVVTLMAVVLLDGVRRLPVGTLVLRKTIGRPWRLVPILETRYRLMSWLAPFALTLVVPPGAAHPHAEDDPEPLLRRRTIVATRLFAGATLIVLVVGVPMLGRWLRTIGFFAGVGVVFTLSAMTAASAWYGGRTAPGPSRWWAVSLLSPFAAPRAGDALAEHALRRASPIAVARALLAPEQFARWLRPRAYDRLQAGAVADEDLDAQLSTRDLEAIVGALPAPSECGPGQAFCPRCGSCFQDASVACGRCDVAPVSVGERMRVA